ncbi:MAG TPA: hypothetical protein VGB85_29995, partial [Nannocystis sp.]
SALRGPQRAAALLTAQTRTRAADRSARVTLDGLDDDASFAAAGTQTAVRLEGTFKARTPGTYLVVARWLDDHGKPGPVVDATCIRFDVPRRELWASVTIAPDLTMLTPIRDYSAVHLRTQLGYTWYLARPWLGVGVAGGYTFTRYVSSAGLPSWQDFQADPATGAQPLKWRRHALVVGPLVELRSRRAGLPVELRARMSAGLGVALVDVAGVSTLPNFATAPGYGPASLRLRSTFDATLELGLGYHAGPLAIAHVLTLGAVAINDMFSATRAVTATSGAGLFAGIGLILGGTP